MATRLHTVEDGQGNILETTTVTIPDEQANLDTILDDALKALALNRTYIDRASPTTAQTSAQVKLLSREINGLIRVLLNKFDGTE